MIAQAHRASLRNPPFPVPPSARASVQEDDVSRQGLFRQSLNLTAERF